MQRIKHITVCNIGPIVGELSVDFDLSSSLTMIKGPNGFGKSTLLKAITALQTGHFPDSLSEILNRQSKKGFISGVFVDDAGKEYKRYHGLGSDKERSLTLPDNTVLSKDKEIKSYLFKFFQCSADTLMKTVFVKQGSLSGIISDERAARVKTIAELSGVDSAEVIWAALGKRIGSYKINPEAVENFNNTEKELNEAKTLYESAKAALDSLPKIEDSQSYYSVINLYHQRLQNEQKLSELKEPSVNTENTALLARLTQEISDLTSFLKAISINDLEEIIRSFDRSYSLRAKLPEMESLKERLAAWKSEGHTRPEDTTEDLTEYVELLQEAKEALKTSKAALDSLGDGKCYACNQEIPDAAEHIAKHTKKKEKCAAVIQKLSDKIEKVNETKKAIKEAQQAFDKKLISYQVNLEKVEQFYRELNSMPTISKEESDAATAAIENYKATQKLIAEKSAQLVKCKDTISVEKSKLAVYTSTKTSLLDAIASAPPREEAELAKEKITYIKKLEEDSRAISTSFALAKTNLSRINSLWEDVKAKKQEYDKNIKIVSALTKLREYFHRDNLPSIVSRKFIQEAADRSNEYMRAFEADFSIGYDLSEMAFTADYANGIVLGIHQLSGGWSVASGLCLRCAVSDLISSNMKTLILDESIVYLDKDNLARVPFVLEKIKAVNKTLGRQMLIVTHEQTLLSVADTVITLG